MRQFLKVCCILWLGGTPASGTEESEGTTRRIRRRIRYIPKYEQHLRSHNQTYTKNDENGLDMTVLDEEYTNKKQPYHEARYDYNQAYKTEYDYRAGGEGDGYDVDAHTWQQNRYNDDPSFHTAHLEAETRGIENNVPFPTQNPASPPVEPPEANPTTSPTIPTAEPPTQNPANPPAPEADPTTSPTIPTAEPATQNPASQPVEPPEANPTTSPATTSPSEPPTKEDREMLIEAKCGITALERSRDILVELLKVSRAPGLVDPATSQYAARDWIDNIDPAIICPENFERIHQRYRLALLYYEMGGSEWTLCESDGRPGRPRNKYGKIGNGVAATCSGVPFLDKKNECEWYGLSCGDSYSDVEAESPDRYFPVEVIDLRSSNLTGELFDELYGFQGLEKLLLNGNRGITGTLSEDIGDLASLQILELQSNTLSGIVPETALLKLERLGKVLFVFDNRYKIGYLFRKVVAHALPLFFK